MIKEKLLISLGWLLVFIATIGIVLPILPTTPFLVLALFLFANSSPRFHRMLLNNRWFGPVLIRWETTKTVSRHTKRRASLLILVSFSISIALMHASPVLQITLSIVAIVLLTFILRL